MMIDDDDGKIYEVSPVLKGVPIGSCPTNKENTQTNLDKLLCITKVGSDVVSQAESFSLVQCLVVENSRLVMVKVMMTIVMMMVTTMTMTMVML